MSSRTAAIIAVVVTSVFWSTSGTVSKVLLSETGPFTVAFLRFAVASLIVLPVFLVRNRIPFRKLITEVLPVTVFSAGNIAFFYIGLSYTTANASLMIYTAVPLVVALLSHYLLGERFPMRKVAGILIGLVGVMLVILLPVLEQGSGISGNTTGNLLVAVAVLCWSVYSIGSKTLTNKGYPPFTVTAMSLFTVAVIFLVLYLMTSPFPLPPQLFAPRTLLLFLYLGLFVTVLTFFLYQWVIQKASPTIASFTTYLQPVFGVLINAVFLEERVTPGFAVGSLIALGGVYLASGMNGKRRA